MLVYGRFVNRPFCLCFFSVLTPNPPPNFYEILVVPLLPQEKACEVSACFMFLHRGKFLAGRRGAVPYQSEILFVQIILKRTNQEN